MAATLESLGPQAQEIADERAALEATAARIESDSFPTIRWPAVF